MLGYPNPGRGRRKFGEIEKFFRSIGRKKKLALVGRAAMDDDDGHSRDRCFGGGEEPPVNVPAKEVPGFFRVWITENVLLNFSDRKESPRKRIGERPIVLQVHVVD